MKKYGFDAEKPFYKGVDVQYAKIRVRENSHDKVYDIEIVTKGENLEELFLVKINGATILRKHLEIMKTLLEKGWIREVKSLPE